MKGWKQQIYITWKCGLGRQEVNRVMSRQMTNNAVQCVHQWASRRLESNSWPIDCQPSLLHLANQPPLKPASLALSVAWLLPWLGDTGFVSRLGRPFIFISPHPHVCKLWPENGTLLINSRLYVRLDKTIPSNTASELKDNWNSCPVWAPVSQPEAGIKVRTHDGQPSLL